ncbi:hypothetical protein Tco_0414970 [Tanacetum coccineum]
MKGIVRTEDGASNGINPQGSVLTDQEEVIPTRTRANDHKAISPTSFSAICFITGSSIDEDGAPAFQWSQFTHPMLTLNAS